MGRKCGGYLSAAGAVLSRRMGRWPWYYFLGAFAVVPFILLSVAALPMDAKIRYCILDLQYPSLVPMYLMHYTHSEIPHLASNISFYLITLTALFLLETSRRRLFWVSAGFFTVLPFALSILSIVFLPYFGSARWAEGFSGIAFAFFGYAVALAMMSVYQRFLSRAQEGWNRLNGFLEVCTLLDIACFDAALFLGILFLGITFGKIGPENGLAHFSGYIAGAFAPLILGVSWKRRDSLARLCLILVLIGTINIYILYGIRAAAILG
ncbi:MAG: hypothetical protein LUQ40_00320 [Methanomicrobiales archaeon]|nr:hypothetical protein [Methanomicrobiales archaeon]